MKPKPQRQEDTPIEPRVSATRLLRATQLQYYLRTKVFANPYFTPKPTMFAT